MNKKIGIIGGMGPMATQLFYKMVTEMTDAACDQEHVNMVICSDASMPDRTGAILKGEYEEVYQKLLADAKMLEDCGCEAIGITCNTAHFFGDMIVEKLNIPIIHMVKETVKTIAEKYPGSTTAILATDGTVKTQLYQRYMEEAGLKPYVPEPEVQKMVMYEIYDRIKSGKETDTEVWSRIEEAVKKAGCKTAIMGCTELSVVKEECGLDEMYIDPMRVLAAKMIAFSGRKLKEGYQIYL